MAQFSAFSPNTEVNGETVLSIVKGMGTFQRQALALLAGVGIKDPRPGQWYPQQAWLNAFKQISEQLGPNTLQSIGKQIPENANFPPGINSIDTALPSIDQAYHMNHRGGDIGYYRFSALGPGKGSMECRNPYPCDFDRGVILGTANKFRSGGNVPAVVTHHPPTPCRAKGGDLCTYLVTW